MVVNHNHRSLPTCLPGHAPSPRWDRARMPLFSAMSHADVEGIASPHLSQAHLPLLEPTGTTTLLHTLP